MVTRKQRNIANLRKRAPAETKKTVSPARKRPDEEPLSNDSDIEIKTNPDTPSPSLTNNRHTAGSADLLLAESIGSRSMRQKKVTVNASMTIMTSTEWIAKYGKDYGNQPPKSIIEQPSVNNEHKEVLSLETGVEKNEEKEEHLKKILQNKDATKHEYIPTPDASKLWAGYNDVQISKFVNPEHYIVGSATLEECFGIEYLMDEEDEAFLKTENLQEKISEDQFELICQIFEEIITEQQPFLTVEPQSILSYDDVNDILTKKLEENLPMLKSNLCSTTTNEEKGVNLLLKKQLLKQLSIPNYIKLIWESDTTNETLSPESEKKILAIWKSDGFKIYNHWRERKLKASGDTIRPHLRFEKNGEKNDNDPYICFRRREIRQVRKTRKMDKINSQKLYILLEQMERTKDIIHNVNEREVIKQEQILSWENVYRQRKTIREKKIPISEPDFSVIIDEQNLNMSKKKQFLSSAGSLSDSLLEAVDFDLRRKLNLQMEELKFVKENNIEELKQKINKKMQQKQAAKKKKQQERSRLKQNRLEEERQFKKRKTAKGYGEQDYSLSGSSSDKKSKVLKDLDPNNINSSASGYSQYDLQQMKSSVYTEAKNNSIPEHELKNVEYILSEKQKQTKQFFEDSMFKRFCEDSSSDYVNFTDCTLNPSMDFNIPSNMLNKGAAFASSLSGSRVDIFNIGYNPVFDSSKCPSFEKPTAYSPELSQFYNKDAIKSNVKVIDCDGNILNNSDHEPRSQTDTNSDLLGDLFGLSRANTVSVDSLDKYILPETYNMDAECKHASMKEQTGRSCSIEKQHTKELPFLNRKRTNRFNEVFVDKQYNHLDQAENQSTDVLSEFFDFGEIEAQEHVSQVSDSEKTAVSAEDTALKHSPTDVHASEQNNVSKHSVTDIHASGKNKVLNTNVIDVYASEKDAYLRMVDRWKFDIDHYIHDPPLVETSSILNSIPRETQVIRFSTMLGTKASDKMKEVQHQYRRDLINKVKKDQVRRQRYVEQVRKKQKQMLALQKQQQEHVSKKQNESSSSAGYSSKKTKKLSQTPSKQATPSKQKLPTPAAQITKKQEHS